jgi:hypothetical protein
MPLWWVEPTPSARIATTIANATISVTTTISVTFTTRVQ